MGLDIPGYELADVLPDVIARNNQLLKVFEKIDTEHRNISLTALNFTDRIMLVGIICDEIRQ